MVKENLLTDAIQSIKDECTRVTESDIKTEEKIGLLNNVYDDIRSLSGEIKELIMTISSCCEKYGNIVGRYYRTEDCVLKVVSLEYEPFNYHAIYKNHARCLCINTSDAESGIYIDYMGASKIADSEEISEEEFRDAAYSRTKELLSMYGVSE